MATFKDNLNELDLDLDAAMFVVLSFEPVDADRFVCAGKPIVRVHMLLIGI
jgi:hypothetical protein